MRRLITIIFSVCFASILNAQVPIAQFSADQITACAGVPINFTDLSNYGGSTIVSTNWDFGEGGQSTQQNPSYTYTSAGTYQVLLTVISVGGTDFELKLNYITINANPLASFSTSGNGCTVPFAVTFTNLSTIGAAMSYAWDFGNLQTSTTQNPGSVTYASAGSYNMQLITVNSITGCTDTATETLIVSDFTAAINAPATACVGETVLITDATTVGVNSWSWTSGDGQTSNLQTPSFTYPTPGTYTISLIAQNSISGCIDNATQDISINPSTVASFTADLTAGCAPLLVNFTNTSGAGTFTWDFGNGQTSILAAPPAITYAADGSFTVSLTSVNASGCSSSTVLNNMIVVGPPTADFSSDLLNGCAPLSVQFTDLSFSVNPIADPIISWLWDFGDGTTFSGQNPPAHVYGIGTYSVSLTITTSNGCSVTKTIVNAIEVGMIDLVDFSLFPIIECAKHDITFTDLSVISTPHTADEVTYDWSFGDGGTSTLQNPVYDFPIDTGFFDIQLIVNFRGCADTLTRIDQVYIQAPISKFAVQTLYCNPPSFPLHVNVKDFAIAGAATDNVDMIWDWGIVGDPDDLLANADVFDINHGDTAHNYMTYGTYVIKQIVHNYTTGCTDSTQINIVITKIDAGFLLSNDTTCSSMPITISSTSTFLDPIATFIYDMGNGDVISGDPLSYIYNTPGDYNISLITTNSAGCSDSAEFLGFHVLDPPIASILGSEDAGCLPINVVYTNTSTIQGNGVPLSSFLWTFPDGSAQTTNNLVTATDFDYTAQGLFATTLIATDVFGCVSQPAGFLMLITNPTVNFIMDAAVCDLEVFTAVNTTTGFGGLSYAWEVDGSLFTNDVNLTDSFDETPSPSHTSVAHSITLIATDGNGCQDSITKIVNVSLPLANLNYVASGATVNAAGEFTCPPVFESFTDLSTSYGALTSWNWSFGDGKISAFQNPNNTYVFPGTYTLNLTVTDEFGCTADTSLVDYLKILGPEGTINWEIFGDQCEHIYSFSATSLTFVDSIVWDLNDGTIVFDSTLFTHTYAIGTYNPTSTLIDSLGCQVTYPMQTLVAPIITIEANAGPDQSFCGSNGIMAGVVSPYGNGLWTLFSGTATITSPNSNVTTLSNIGVGVNVFVWTITNACDTIRDTMQITIQPQPSIAFAGPDQSLCASATVLEASSATNGTGVWSTFSGSGSVTDPTNPSSTVNALGVGLNQFVWNISNTCSVNSDTVSIILETTPTVADAGPDQTVCGTSSNFTGNTALSGNGIWTLISGAGVIADINMPNSAVTGLGLDTNIFVWTISNTCGITSDTVQLFWGDFPLSSTAGNDITICQTNAVLVGNHPIIGEGEWTLISGTGAIVSTSDSTANVTGLSVGQNVFAWVVSTVCEVASDQMVITVETTPTVAAAGPDQVICGNSGNLAATPVVVGVGAWTLILGTGVIASPNSPTSAISGLSEGLNVFQWTVSNSCTTTADQVSLNAFPFPKVAIAGPDQALCVNFSTLSADSDIYGIWTVISGTGVIANPLDPNSTVTNLSVGPNVFHWAVTNPCGSTFDNTTINLETSPPIAVVGRDTVCGNIGILIGNSPSLAAGEWTLISGAGSINTISDSASGVNNLAVGLNIFEWTISNTCSSSAAQMTIFNTGQCPNEDSLNSILYFYVPNTFTPNNDDINQTFQPVFTMGYDSQNFSLWIYDRWGELIFESHDADKGWNGTFGGDDELVEDGTYTWKIKFTDTDTYNEHRIVGHVNVLK